MKNNYRTRMTAWILAVIIALCMMPITSMANIVEPIDDFDEDAFVVNRYTDCSVVYEDENGKVYTDLSRAGRGKQYTMNLTVKEDSSTAALISEGEMIFTLPDKVGEIISISGTDVEGVQSGNTIRFTWKGGKKPDGKKSFSAQIKFTTASNVYDLYNIANINGTYYRLAKSTITTDKELSKNLGKQLEPGDYTIQKYNFKNLKITVNGKEYIYQCEENTEEIEKSGRYYTVDFVNIDAVKNKIGALDGSGNPRWLVPENQRYSDANNTDSYHANYAITLNEEPYEQDLYNLLQIAGTKVYYRLRKSRIVAHDPNGYKNAAVLTTNDYQADSITDYKFKGVTLKYNGEIYKYSDHVLTKDEKKDGFESYFTVKPNNIVRQERINGDTAWYENDDGWLDGSKEQYGAEGNDVVSFHRNYIATLYKGTRSAEEKSVKITSDWPEGKPAYAGTMITLTANPKGFTDGEYTIQWQRSTDKTTWTDIDQANSITYTYELNSETTQYFWRVVVTDKDE